MNRRGFLSGILALSAAPAIVKAANLMPIWVQRESGLYVSGIPYYDGVDLNFTTADLTLSLDNFSERIIGPALIAIAQRIDDDVFYRAQKIALADYR